jgi:hypothetical protein
MMEAETIQTTRTLPGENKNNNNDDDSDAPRSGGGESEFQQQEQQQQQQPPESATNVARAYIPSIAPSVPKGTATILLVFTTWVMLYCVLGDVLLPNVNQNNVVVIPGGAVFSLIFIWAAAHVGATLAKLINVPPLLTERPGRGGRGVAERVEFGDESGWVVRDFNAVGFGVGFSSF